MKRFLLTLAILPCVLMAADKPKKKPAAPKPAAAPMVVPAGAKQVDALTWRYTDAQGKIWTYRTTPFGLVRYEEKADAQASESLPPGMKAAEEGDKVRFERPSPFGPLKWVKGKDELNEVERMVWERDSKAAAAPKE